MTANDVTGIMRPRQVDKAYDVSRFLIPGPRPEFTACDLEPIHLSGAIQPHGVLLAAQESDFMVRRASANTQLHLGMDPSDLLGASLAKALGSEAVEALRLALEHPRPSGWSPIDLDLATGAPYELTWHRSDGLVVVELEPADVEGAVSSSALFADVRHAMQDLQAAEGVRALCDLAATAVRHLTGYDRVMVYRFHPDWHGEVVAEDVAPDLEHYLGQHYPASDIPHQARRLYLINHLRVIADVDYEPSPLLGAPDFNDVPLDLSLSTLRSVSPIHLTYLRNMGTQATLTISLMRGTRLWGMLSCHHRTPKRVDAQLRAACRVLGQMCSLQVVTLEDQERASYRARLAKDEARLVARLSTAESLAGAVSEAPELALALASADGLVARLDGETVTAGEVPPPAAVELLVARLCADEEPSALVCDDLPHRFAELAPYAEHAAGVLALPLSAGYEDFVLWFRGELVQGRTWAGNPDKPMIGDPTAGPGEAGPTNIGPRSSFEGFVQELRGHSRPWLAAEIETGRAFAATVPEFQLARARVRLAEAARVAHLGTHDPLTGLPNRALLIDRSAAALARPARRGRRVVLLFIDLDRFKLVNDSLGHAAGDELLRQAAQRITSCIRHSETVARIGGDEFVVLCEDLTAAQASRLAERIIQAFRAPFVLSGHEALVTASIGVAVAERGATPDELLRDADDAMYRSKRSGRNAATPFTHELRAITLRRVEIETSLRPALERGELHLYYQPIHDINGTLTGFEALARWLLTGRGMVPPDEFVPVAESTGLFDLLTEWVLEEGLTALAGWRGERPDLGLTLAVNIAASQIGNDRLWNTVERSLQSHHLPASALCLEITESALVADDALSQRFLRRLRDQGVRLSIDDFGTGYSSLDYLTKLPVHELKIDRGFVARLPASRADAVVVASVVGLAHQLGLEVLAEGVETEDQLATVRRLGCDRVQGYFLGRPMPADEIDTFITGVQYEASSLP